MTVLLGLAGLAIAALSAGGVASPTWIMELAGGWRSATRLWALAGFRLALGALCWVAAPDTRFPLAVRVVAVVALAVGLVAPLFGTARLERMLEWWMRRSDAFIRAWSAVGVAFGIFLASAAF